MNEARHPGCSPDTISVNDGDQWVTAGATSVPANTVLAAASCCGPTYGLKNTGTFTVAAGSGTVAADGLEFDNAGKLKLSSGTLQLATLEQTAGATTLAGTTPGAGLGQLAVTGSVTLAGRLKVATSHGFPHIGPDFRRTALRLT